MKNPSIDIIIPNWNGKELLEAYLPAVCTAFHRLPADEKHIIIVDDGSTDESVMFVQTEYPSIHLIINGENVGFHRSINRAAKQSTADLILLLNSDMEPEPDAFFQLYTHFGSQDHLFAVSGRIFDDDKKTFLYGNRSGIFRHGHFILQEKEPSATSQTLFACGGAGLYNRTQFLELGGFDILFYPFYYEEQDVSYRALKRGWSIRYEPNSCMYHRVQASIGKKLSRTHIRHISARNNYLFIIKNITDPAMIWSFIFFTPLGILSALLKGNPRFLIAFCMAIPRIPRALILRWIEKKHYIKKDRDIFEAVNQ